MLIAFALPLIGCASLLVACTAGIYYATYGVRSQWLGQTAWHGRQDTGAVALTLAMLLYLALCHHHIGMTTATPLWAASRMRIARDCARSRF